MLRSTLNSAINDVYNLEVRKQGGPLLSMISFDYITFYVIIYLCYLSFYIFMLLTLEGGLEETFHPSTSSA